MSYTYKQSKFWYVYNPFGNKPAFAHYNKQSAIDEASRLAVSTGEDFQVLECVAIVRKPIVPAEVLLLEERVRDPDKIPF